MKIQLDNKVYDVDTNQSITDFIDGTGLSLEKAAFLYEIVVGAQDDIPDRRSEVAVLVNISES